MQLGKLKSLITLQHRSISTTTAIISGLVGFAVGVLKKKWEDHKYQKAEELLSESIKANSILKDIECQIMAEDKKLHTPSSQRSRETVIEYLRETINSNNPVKSIADAKPFSVAYTAGFLDDSKRNYPLTNSMLKMGWRYSSAEEEYLRIKDQKALEVLNAYPKNRS